MIHPQNVRSPVNAYDPEAAIDEPAPERHPLSELARRERQPRGRRVVPRSPTGPSWSPRTCSTCLEPAGSRSRTCPSRCRPCSSRRPCRRRLTSICPGPRRFCAPVAHDRGADVAGVGGDAGTTPALHDPHAPSVARLGSSRTGEPSATRSTGSRSHVATPREQDVVPVWQGSLVRDAGAPRGARAASAVVAVEVRAARGCRCRRCRRGCRRRGAGACSRPSF